MEDGGRMREKAGHVLKQYLKMTVAALIYSAGVSLFLAPNALAPGGVTGIAVILYRVTGLETGTWILLINIPILIVGTWKFGWRFILSTIYCTILASTFTNVLSLYGAVTEDFFLAALAGGSLIALGLGLTLKSGSTTGGMDIVIKLLRIRMPHLRTGSLLLILDTVVVAAAGFILRDLERALYAGMSVFITSFVLDLVLYGKDEAKLIFIISDKAHNITMRFLEELKIGVTYIQGAGAYSDRDKKIIMCVMRKQLSPKAESIVREEDSRAFMIVSSASEIYGEGYKSYFGERL